MIDPPCIFELIAFFMFFCRLLIFFKHTFGKNSFRNTISKANSLDPEQAQDYQQTTLVDKRVKLCQFVANFKTLFMNNDSKHFFPI